MSTVVRNLATGDKWEAVYDLPPREAVRNAYAQYGRGDYNTWDYAKRYDHLVVEGNFTFACGDFCALKEGYGPTQEGGES